MDGRGSTDRPAGPDEDVVVAAGGARIGDQPRLGDRPHRRALAQRQHLRRALRRVEVAAEDRERIAVRGQPGGDARDLRAALPAIGDVPRDQVGRHQRDLDRVPLALAAQDGARLAAAGQPGGARRTQRARATGSRSRRRRRREDRGSCRSSRSSRSSRPARRTGLPAAGAGATVDLLQQDHIGTATDGSPRRRRAGGRHRARRRRRGRSRSGRAASPAASVAPRRRSPTTPNASSSPIGI